MSYKLHKALDERPTPKRHTFEVPSRPAPPPIPKATINDRPNRFVPHAGSPVGYVKTDSPFGHRGLDLGEEFEDGWYKDFEFPEHDPVNKPSHYTSGNVECIDAIESAVAGLPGKEAFLVGQVMKYVWRFDKKNGVQDLEKAQWYLERLIEFRK